LEGGAVERLTAATAFLSQAYGGLRAHSPICGRLMRNLLNTILPAALERRGMRPKAAFPAEGKPYRGA